MKMISNISLILLLSFVILITSNIKSISQVTDKDGNFYKTIIINNQEWMAENLNVEHYRNGDPIPQVQDNDEWSNLKTGAWSYHLNKSIYGTTYGKLYNWYAVNDKRGLAPKGWHIPSDDEWTELIDYLGGESFAGGKMKSLTLWENPSKRTTNESGFTALPGGYRYSDKYFSFLGTNAYFWSSSEYDKDYAWERSLNTGISVVWRRENAKECGLSIRCIRNSEDENSKEIKNEYSKESKIDIITKAIIINGPVVPSNFFDRGYAYFELGDYLNAILDYTKAIELRNNYGDAYRLRSVAYAKNKEYSKAITDCTKAIDLYFNDPTCGLSGVGDIYYNRGIDYYNSGKTRNACDDWGIAYSVHGYAGAKELMDKYCKK